MMLAFGVKTGSGRLSATRTMLRGARWHALHAGSLMLHLRCVHVASQHDVYCLALPVLMGHAAALCHSQQLCRSTCKQKPHFHKEVKRGNKCSNEAGALERSGPSKRIMPCKEPSTDLHAWTPLWLRAH